MIITANDLKVKGISILEVMLQKLDEVFVSVRGKNRFVVVDIQRYNYLRECELEKALQESREDIRMGNSRVLTSKQHFEELDSALRD